MTPEEKTVIQAAIAWKEGLDPIRFTRVVGDPSDVLLNSVNALIYRCADCSSGGHQCPGDGKSIPHGETDCGEHDECECSRDQPVYCASTECHGGSDIREWILTDWIHVLPGDTIRMPGKTQEATVQSLHIGEWHADVESRLMDSGRWWDNITAWDHKEIGVRLTHMPERLLPFRTDAPIEILMNEERKAILVLQGAFPGSTIVQS